MTYGGGTYAGSAYAGSDTSVLNIRTGVFRVIRDGDTVEDAVFDVDPLVDTANPFGDYCVIKMDDSTGNRFDAYPRGTRVEVEIGVSPTATITRFVGYVVERRENEQQGADVLEVEAYSFDQFLRRNTVTNDQRGNTISQALADIIQTDTPVTYDATNVSVGDDQELTRSYQGEAVEAALRDFAFKSNNEDFGVNDALEFFFRPRETRHIDRGVDNTEWFRYDIPELGKEAINEVEVWYADGEESVIVDDGTDKLDLQDNLGLPSPGTQRAELNRPLITDIADAEDIGRKYLAFRSSTLSGTVTTFGLYGAEPGDTIDITIEARGIDAEFLIASVEYRWGVDETTLTIVEKRGDVDDILSDLNESVQRVEMEGANRDAPKNRITTTNATGIIAVDVDADGNTPDADRLVNDGQRAIRDTWTGDAPPDITTLLVGDDGTGLSRSNDTLRNQTASASVSQSLPDATRVAFTASVTETGVQEVGLEAADGTLITRAVFADPVDLAGDVTITLDVSNDASVSRGVLTAAGQTGVRDVLADNAPALPNAYAYGDDATAVSDSDTALGNELVEVSLDDILIQSASTSSDWERITPDIAAETPLLTSGDALGMAQTSFTTTASDLIALGTYTAVAFSDQDGFVGGDQLQFSSVGEYAEFEITLNYTVPVINTIGQLVPYIRGITEGDAGANSASFDVSINGEVFHNMTVTDDLEWETGQAYDEVVEPGTYTIRFEVTGFAQSGDTCKVDVFNISDGRFNYTFDNTLSSTQGHLDGPELYPPTLTQSLVTAETRRELTEANFTSTWTDTSGDQYVELANDGSTFTRFTNADSGSVTFASAETSVDTNLRLSRYGSRTGETPLTGFEGQAISEWELRANPDAVLTDNIGETLARAIVPPNTLAAGTTLREAGLKSGSTLLTRHLLAEFDVLADQRIASAETTEFTGDN